MSQPPTPVDVSSLPAGEPNDNRRFGLVQVHPKTTDDEEVSKKKVDIIFMHGLDAQSPKTWVAWVREDDPRSGNVNWLSDEHMLPAAMPDARILTYDWNSNYDRTASRERLVGHADALLERISRDREDFNRHGTPVMFVASCYSGLLLAQALVRATEIYLPRYKVNRKILDCVAGVAFLGTPFGGSWKTGNLVASLRVRNAVNGAKEYNREFIEYLRPGTRDAPSPLEDLVQRFTYMIRHEDFKFGIVCFYETRDTDFSPYKTKLPQSDGSQLDGNGHGIVVDQNSACLQGVDRIGLDVKHNMLHKYNSQQNEGFKHLTSRLREFQRRAELKQSKIAKLHDKCLEALYFDGINYEPGQIREASEGSCQWLLEHPIYSNWHKKGRGVFWILGNPGSGKNTLMKHAGHRLQHTVEGLLRGLLRQLLEKAPGHMHNFYNKLDIDAPKGLHDSRWVASTLVKLLEEALAAVLDHVNIRIFVDALDECRVGEEDDDTQDIEDLVQKLREIEELMRAKPESLSICFACRHDPPLASLNKDPYIKTEWENGGAIEEYVQQELLRITDDEQLRSDLQTEIVHSANGNFLWASLVTAEAIRLRRRGLPVEERIRNTPRQISTIYEEILCRLSRETPAMSLKVFQWLCFALQTFPLHAFRFACDVDAPGTDSLSLWERPDSLTYDDNPRLERLIRTLSGGLAEVDADGDVVLIHQSVKDFLIKDGFRILDPEQNTHQKVMASGHGLLLSSCLWWLARSDLSEVFQVLMDTFDPAIIGIVLNMNLNHGKFEPLFELSSKLKLNSEDCSRCLGDDMQSAVDGLSSSDRATLRGVLSGEVEICDFWSASYREGIVSKKFDNWHVADEIYACWCIKIILIALEPSFTVYLYARELWVCQALETANNGGSSMARSEIHKFCSQLEPQDATICNRILGMLHLAASYPESWVLEQLLVHVPSSSLDINSMCGGYGWTPIMTAIRLGNVENIRTLLAHEKSDVNAKNLSDQTALFVAVVEGNYLLTELLINKGASLDIQCGKGYTALIYAVFRDEFEIMNLLLENGANVHLKIHEGWDAIDFAHGRCLDGLSRFLDRKIALRDKEI